MRKVITKGMRLLLLGGMTACCLIGCGSRVASETNNQRAASGEKNQQVSEEKQQEEIADEKEAAVADNVKADNTDVKTDDKQDVSYTDSGIPVYGEDDKGKIKKYLSSLPDKVDSFQKMKKLGIIGGMHNRYLYSQKENNYFDKEWYKFLTITRKAEERERDRKQGKGVYDVSTRNAIVMLSYTTEGDTIYDYISYIDGKYYLYTDYSRDRFGGGEFFGSYEEVVEHTDTKAEAVKYYYLISEEDVPEEKWEKWLAEDGYDVKKINQVYTVENSSSDVTAIYNN